MPSFRMSVTSSSRSRTSLFHSRSGRFGFCQSRGKSCAKAAILARCSVTPCTDGGDAAREIVHFWEDVLGAETVVLEAARHDAQLAATSHVPQVVASLLGDYLARHAPPGSTFGPGAADTTRLAASEPALWTEILRLNRDEILPALRALEESLGTVERALEVGDAAALAAWLTRAASWRRRLGGQ